MRAQDRIRPTDKRLFRRRPGCARLALLAACIAAGAGFLCGQATQPAQPPANGRQAQSPSQQQSPAPQPMVMGENPDSDPGYSSPPPAAAAVAPAAAQPSPPAVATPAVQPVSLSPAAPVAEPAAAAPAVAAPPPVPVPANAGGDAARQAINNDCAGLLKMANELKAAVDKTNKDVLSIAVVRKANQIEQLAHHVRDEMRPGVGKK